ncbi:TonB-dependent receptor [Flavobacterium circumlabens]|uniref:Outer membrane receptor protein involved in Fe transport n=1 Tax=Flavobacterium circumlabens TaxID=2133765 RepID=A0A4Y7U8T9_9FLAO|nr:TonB-dependent receptor [Flavobacterium circumlabens]TCN53915.1 outer membrane receptor protein involved in Fe transport [Flavobacterium circumlabens]TEB42498.1 TonB-dependent receptor [Flavobacterium circumlabens]
MKFNLKFLLITLFICTISIAQNKGTISGVLTDKESNNQALPFANVLIKGTNISANTDIDGKYTLSINPGSYTIIFSFVGYESVEKPVTVKANETITVDQVLSSGGYTLKDVVVKSSAVNRQKESALLLEQKNAVDIKQSIGAQELSRKGVSDVSGAVTKTTGITKQEGTGAIFVRGLGDRYNSTTMNGLPIPSNDAEKKNINLDIFSTDIIEYVSIDKVYNSKFFGDFAGGNVDIVSKDYKGNGFFKIDAESKINTNAVSEKNFTLQEGPNAFGFSKTSIPNNSLTEYNFNTLQLSKKTPLAASFGLSAGDTYKVGEEGKISLFGTASFSNDYASRTNGIAKGSVNASGVAGKNLDYNYQSYNTNTTGMLNAGYKINNNNKISFNSLYINTSSQKKEESNGYIVDLANDGNGYIRRNDYEKSDLWVNQLLGQHKLGDRTNFNWGGSYNIINQNTPDRTYNTMNKLAEGYVINSQSAPNNSRYFQDLKETETAANLSLDYKFKKDGNGIYKGKITAGYNGRFKKRDFEATQFNFKTTTSPVSHTGDVVDPNNLDLFYNQTNFNNNFFTISTFRGGYQVEDALDPQVYSGDLTINGGFVNTEYKFNKLTAVLGLRGEYILQNVAWNTSLDPTGDNNELKKTAFLPSLVLKYELNDKQNLRLGLSKTYTLPQFKERAKFVYEEFLQAKFGNPYLYASDDYNLDLKWEMFPKSDELISVTAFGKYILNPINETTVNSSTNDISWANTGDYGYAAGAEVEYRKTLWAMDTENSKKLTGGLNVSYLYSNQELNDAKVLKETHGTIPTNFTNKTGKFTGASDLLLNADLSFFNEWNDKKSNLTTTIAYNYFSDRVNAIGTQEKGDLVDKAVGTLDFIARSKLSKHFGLGLIAKNLLDPTVKTVQENTSGDVVIRSYKKGLNLNLAFSYEF